MKIWDLPTRLYHWAQALLFLGLLITGNSGEGPHIPLGLTLLIWRIIWGWIGSQTSRFAQFIKPPRDVVRYFHGEITEKAGHNPAGGWMVILMLSTLFIQCLSGAILAGLLDNISILGELLTDSVVGSVAVVHGIVARLLPILVAIHLLAILIYKLRAKPLVWAMVTGYRKEKQGNLPYFESNKRALLVLLASSLVTIAIIA